MHTSPEKTVNSVCSRGAPAFVLLTFEGPDEYARAGLGTRVSGLACALAEEGYVTHLFFIGSPDPRVATRLRHKARRTALRFTWGQVIRTHIAPMGSAAAPARSSPGAVL